MFGFIKKLFSGIAAFFGGLIGGKKSQDDTSKALKPKKSKGFYLELDEIENAKVAIQENIAEPLKAAAGTIAQKLEPAKETVGVAIADRLKAEPAPEAKKSAPEAKKSAPEAKKSKSNKIAVPSKNEQVQVEAQPNPPAPSTNGKVDPQAEQTFAPKYLMPTASQSRRRPGPSLDMFRDMARQVKTPG